ncbi:MAG: hypothetical protein RSC76_03860 [Oscillospiraceae bacterium]
MVLVRNNDIELTRGDSLYLDVALTQEDGQPYVLGVGDRIQFTLRRGAKKNSEDGEILLEKSATALPLRLAPEDTAKFDYGSYVYDVELHLVNGDVFTVVAMHGFRLTEEVS